MPVYKDKNNTWFASFIYRDIAGERKRKVKRGFKLQKDARAYETEFLKKEHLNLEMSFNSLLELYYEDLEPRVRKSTLSGKKYMISSKLVPFFGKMSISNISPIVVRKWQNSLIGQDFSQTYLKTINNQLCAIMNFAVRYYNLKENPCHKAGSMGKKYGEEMFIWTTDEFNKAISLCEDYQITLAFKVLFYSGARVGELLALTTTDILQSSAISITKSFTRLSKEDIISPPKTPRSNRVVPIPEFLYNELIEFTQKLYKPTAQTRIFHMSKSTLNKKLKELAELADLTKIRVHDLRHSHASLLIEMGQNVVLISKRLGHEKVDTTLNTYSHLYPNKDYELAQELERFNVSNPPLI